jgi:hypothetical protein
MLHGDVALRRTALRAGLFTEALGAAVLARWTFDISALRNFLSGFVTKKPNMALAFSLCGAALALLSDGKAGRRGGLCATAMLAAVAALSARPLSECLLGAELGWD